MYCTKCGLKNEDIAKFCTACGGSLTNNTSPITTSNGTGAVAIRSKKMPKWVWAAIAAIIAVVVIILCVVLINDRDSNNGVVGKWEREISQAELAWWDPSEYKYIQIGWVFDKLTEEHTDGKMYGYAYYLCYDGSVDHSSYDYYKYCVNEDNTITIIWYDYDLIYGWDITVEDVLSIKSVNGKLALVSQEYKSRVYYYSGNGNEILWQYE